MDQSTPQPGFTKPIGGLLVVLAVALFVGGWLYVDMIKNELEMKIEGLESQLEAERMKAQGQAAQEPAPPIAEEKWQTYSASLNGEQFQFDLPPGYRLSPGTGDFKSEFMYVMPEPKLDGGLPVMTINQTNAATAGPAGAREDGYLVTGSGETAYWLTLWENMEWEPFDRVAASFKIL